MRKGGLLVGTCRVRLTVILYVLTISMTPAWAADAGPAWARGLPIYETSLDLATPHGRFREFEERLDALQDLGVGLIWFLPVFPTGGNPPDKPRSDSAYCVRDYRDVNPRHGSKEEFKHLVAAIHAHGMRVMVDWVPNHSSWGNELIRTHPEFYQKDKDGRIVEASAQWKDAAKFDYSNHRLWEYMFEARKFWITEFDVDGFREDVAGAIPLEHWRWLRPKLNSLKPVFMLAEADNPAMHPAFDMTYDGASEVYFYMIARGTWPASSLDRLLKEEQEKFPAGAIRMRHLTDHDMAREQYSWFNRQHLDKSEYEFLEKTPLPAKYGGGDRAFAVLCATLPNSKPMIWNGQELGILAKTPRLQWTDGPYLEFYRKLLQAYRRNPALHQGEFHRIAASGPDAVYAYLRRAGGNLVVVAVNLSGQPEQPTLELGELAGRYAEVFTAEDRVLAAREKLDLGPWAYRIYVSGSPPPQAAAEGFTRLAFFEDFSSAAGIDMSDTGNAGFNFYRRYPTIFGGKKSLPKDDIMNVKDSVLTFKSEMGPNIGLTSICPDGKGGWTGFTATGGAYFECRMKFDPKGSTDKGWPSFWTTSAEWWCSAGKNAPNLRFLEMDFFEYITKNGYPNRNYLSAVHAWTHPQGGWMDAHDPVGMNDARYIDLPNATAFNSFNTYGTLWVAGEKINSYLNDILTTAQTDLTKYPALKWGDNQHMPVIIGSDGWPMQVDWVKVWTR